MKNTCYLLLLMWANVAFGQKWIAQAYTITTTPDLVYGTATDFAGNERTLLLDVTVPDNDVPPPCGRPLMVVVHGGAFLGGSKADPTVRNMMKDFAQRGYVTASVNYRLGMFQTPAEVHCNITNMFDFPWDCLNMADTSEWYRGAYRAMQDVRGAIRYLVNRREEFKIDPNNVFVVGESAGGFTALLVGYLDSPLEKPAQAAALPNAQAPNKIYEALCIQSTQYDTSIASMKLARPDLGPIEGTLNWPSPAHTLRGIGSFYGGVFSDLLTVNTTNALPALYLYHQPNDLIVPFNTGRVFQGLSNCLTGFPFNCSSIINRPLVYGSRGIKLHLDNLKALGKPVPQYLFDQTNNQTDCGGQILNPVLAGHSIDNYAIRTTALAVFFAKQVAVCTSSSQEADQPNGRFLVYPNPVQGSLYMLGKSQEVLLSATLTDLAGRAVLHQEGFAQGVSSWELPLPAGVSGGHYALRLVTEKGVYSQVVQVQR